MRRQHLEHVLRASARIVGEPDILVVGSQSILGSVDEDRLPPAATASVEADVAFFDDPDDRKADEVDGAIGELSPFHETFGYYAQGVSVRTAVLPHGWRDRLVLLESPGSAPGRGHMLEPHDCVVSKLVAGRQKDHAFADGLIDSGLVDARIVAERIEAVDVPVAVRQRMRTWISHRLPAADQGTGDDEGR